MLNAPFHRRGLTVLLAIGLSAAGCDTSGGNSSTSTAKSKVGGGNKTAMPTAPDKLPADAPMKEVILGRWVSEEADTFSWHLTADGTFVVMSTDKSDLSKFPKELRNKVPSFFGKWIVTDSELVLSDISGQGQDLTKEIRVSCKKINNGEIEIDGVKFTRKAIVPDEPAGSGEMNSQGQ